MFRRISWLWLALGLAILFYPLWFGQVFMWGLPAQQFIPWRDFAREMVWGGHLPLWNPYNGAGAPLLANYQSAIFYPPLLLTYFLPVAPTLSILTVLHLFLGGVGMWQFMRRLGVPELGCGVGALAFGMTSYLLGRVHTFPVIMASVWLPWLLWAVLGLLQNGQPRDVARLALIAALQLFAGHAQTTWYSFTLTGLFAVWYSLRFGQLSLTVRMAWLLAALGGMCLGVGIAAVQLVPTAQLLATSNRAEGANVAFVFNFSYEPARTLNFLLPNIFGTPSNGTYLTRGVFFEDAVYVGLIPLLGAVAALVGWVMRYFAPQYPLISGKKSTITPVSHTKKPIDNLETPHYLASVPLWWGVALIAFVFALGRTTPIYQFLYFNVPTSSNP